MAKKRAQKMVAPMDCCLAAQMAKLLVNPTDCSWGESLENLMER